MGGEGGGVQFKLTMLCGVIPTQNTHTHSRARAHTHSHTHFSPLRSNLLRQFGSCLPHVVIKQDALLVLILIFVLFVLFHPIGRSRLIPPALGAPCARSKSHSPPCTSSASSRSLPGSPRCSQPAAERAAAGEQWLAAPLCVCCSAVFSPRVLQQEKAVYGDTQCEKGAYLKRRRMQARTTKVSYSKVYASPLSHLPPPSLAHIMSRRKLYILFTGYSQII